MDYDLKHVLADTKASMQEDKVPYVMRIYLAFQNRYNFSKLDNMNTKYSQV